MLYSLESLSTEWVPQRLRLRGILTPGYAPAENRVSAYTGCPESKNYKPRCLGRNGAQKTTSVTKNRTVLRSENHEWVRLGSGPETSMSRQGQLDFFTWENALYPGFWMLSLAASMAGTILRSLDGCFSSYSKTTDFSYRFNGEHTEEYLVSHIRTNNLLCCDNFVVYYYFSIKLSIIFIERILSKFQVI